MKSPFSDSISPCIDSVDISNLTFKYKNLYSIDISKYFDGVNKIQVFKCPDTQYKFYYPFNIAGDGKFYEHFQNFCWYYNSWKWEHEVTTNYLQAGQEVLEVGCAKGDFLLRVKENIGVSVTGLELNEKAIEEAKRNGLKVSNDTIQDYSFKHPKEFDVVCSFQVLEHVVDVKSFIEGKINCLRSGGYLVIAVPNNSSFIKYERNGPLNCPPHHMGLWDYTSLKNLEKFFPIKLHKTHYEPLQEYHFEWYRSIMERRLLKLNLLKRVYKKLSVAKIASKFIKYVSPKITGHTILMVYKKI